uniref:hypothetical protein n=1 Tax=Flavobacterium sp. TaxID=239 RepID=UPI0040493860
MRKQIVLLFLIGFFISNGQVVVLNENLNVSETELYIEGLESDYYFKLPFRMSVDFVLDNFYQIFLMPRQYHPHVGLALKYDEHTIFPELYLFDEYSMLKTKELTIYDYHIEINTLSRNSGDTICGKIDAKIILELKGEIVQYQISGSFRHIIGLTLLNNQHNQLLSDYFNKAGAYKRD